MKIYFEGETTAPTCFTENKEYTVLKYEPSTCEDGMDGYIVIGDDGYEHYVLGSGCAYLNKDSTWKVVK